MAARIERPFDIRTPAIIALYCTTEEEDYNVRVRDTSDNYS